MFLRRRKRNDDRKGATAVEMALVMPVYEKYRPALDPGLQLDHIPDTPQEAARYFNSKRNW